MRRAHFSWLALAAAALLVTGGSWAWAQQPDAPKNNKPAAAEKDKPGAKPEQPKPDAPKPGDNRPDAKKDQPAQPPRPDANRGDQAPPRSDANRGDRAPPRPDANRDDRAPTRPDANRPNTAPRSGQATRPGDQTRPPAPRTTTPPRPGNAQDRRDATQDRRDATQDRRDDRRDAAQNRTNRQDDRSTAQGSNQAQRGKQRSASELGFAFSQQESDKGLTITTVNSNTIASKAKFQKNDVIVSVNGNAVATQRDFLYWVYYDTTDRITFVVLRGGEEVTLYLEPAVLFQESVATSGGAWLGVDLDPRYERDVVITRVHPRSPAERAGLRNGDAILSMNDVEMTSSDHLIEMIGQSQPGTTVDLEVDRNGQIRMISATFGQRTEVTRRTEVQPLPLRPRR